MSDATGSAVADGAAGGSAGSKAGLGLDALEATGAAVADGAAGSAAGAARALRAKDTAHLNTYAKVGKRVRDSTPYDCAVRKRPATAAKKPAGGRLQRS